MTIYHSLKIAIGRTYSERNWKCLSSSLSISQKNFLCWLAKMYKTLSIESQFFMALSYFYKPSFNVFSRANRLWLTNGVAKNRIRLSDWTELNDLVDKLMADPWKKMAKPWGSGSTMKEQNGDIGNTFQFGQWPDAIAVIHLAKYTFALKMFFAILLFNSNLCHYPYAITEWNCSKYKDINYNASPILDKRKMKTCYLSILIPSLWPLKL